MSKTSSKIIFYTRPGTGRNIRPVIASAVFIGVLTAILIVIVNPASLMLSISVPIVAFICALLLGTFIDHKRDPIRYVEITKDFLIIGHRENGSAFIAWDTIKTVETDKNGAHRIKIFLKDSKNKQIPLRNFFHDQKETIICAIEDACPQKQGELKLQAEACRDNARTYGKKVLN